MKYISILGVTGSIGTQTIDVIRQEKDNYILEGISANKNFDLVISIINEFIPKYIAITDELTYKKVKSYCQNFKSNIQVYFGIEGLNKIATLPNVDIVVTSIVGMVGLVPTLNAIKAGKNIALANKETLVAGGSLVMEEAKRNNISIFPVDSEHGAIFQCLQGNKKETVRKIILTASGGPFRGKKTNELLNITKEDALKHPKWNMGQKISIDSATLMNKGLEVIEAHWLFNLEYCDINVVVHPQSIIHSMVEYIDGSVIAQLGTTDMKLPIQYAINYPERHKKVVASLDFFRLGNLTFEEPDLQTFKCLKLAYEAGEAGGTMPAILNSANEAAVELFLHRKIGFLQIADIIEECMSKFISLNEFDIYDILDVDRKVKNFVLKNYGE